MVDKEIKGKFKSKKQIRKYKIHVSKLIDGKKFEYTYEDTIMAIILSCGYQRWQK